MRTPETWAMNSRRFPAILSGLLLLGSCGLAAAAQTVMLDPAACRNDRLFAHGFGEDGDLEVGLLTRSFGSRRYFLVVPPGYRHDRTHPLLLALHGTGGSPAGAETNALDIAQTWQPLASTRGMIVVVPVGSTATGSWNAGVDMPFLQLLLAQVEGTYNVDSTRRYLWGFSAGGHFGHSVVLERTDQYAAYAIAAGLLTRHACTSDTCPQYLAAVPRHVPLDLTSGISDPVVPINEISADRGRFLDGGWRDGIELWVTGLNQGHYYTATQLSDSWDRICRFAVVPDP